MDRTDRVILCVIGFVLLCGFIQLSRDPSEDPASQAERHLAHDLFYNQKLCGEPIRPDRISIECPAIIKISASGPNTVDEYRFMTFLNLKEGRLGVYEMAEGDQVPSAIPPSCLGTSVTGLRSNCTFIGPADPGYEQLRKKHGFTAALEPDLD